jgi:hypothetical protein
VGSAGLSRDWLAGGAGQYALLSFPKEVVDSMTQHVFENLSEDLKRPCVDEVLDNLVLCAKNQWGSE